MCVGHTPFRRADVDHVDCPKPPERGSRLCRSCAASDATFASQLHHAHTTDRAVIDPAVAEHPRQPNLLYLAAFRDGSIKVGTTTENRKGKRLAEQGAWRAVFVAWAEDGYAVRDLEDRVTAEVGLAQSVSMPRKLQGMVSPKPDRTLVAELTTWTSSVHALLGPMADDRVRSYEEAWEFPDSRGVMWTGLHRYPLKLNAGQHDIEVTAACGRMVVLGRPSSGDRFVADIGQLYGIELDMGDYESDELAVQDSLF